MKRYIPFAFAFALGWLCLVSGQACSKCNPEGKKNCKANGDCECKPGYDGKYCYDCAAGNYWKDDNKCEALTAYTDTFTVSDIPLAHKCAHDGYTIKFKEVKKIYEYQKVKDAEECQLLCKQWPNCDIWRLDYRNPNDKLCTLSQREAFQNQEFTKLRISGYDDCPRSDGCIENDKFYDSSKALQSIANVTDPYECQKECEGKQDCSHWTHSFDVPDEDTCYLFNGDFGHIATGTNKVGNKEPVNFVSGSVDCNYCFEFHLKFNLLPRIAHASGAASVVADSHLKCQEICLANPLCLWFEWFSTDKACFMTHPWHLLKAKNDVVTASRNCDLACGKCDALGVRDPNDLTCDNAGNCKCKDDYADPLCTKCATGFTRAADGSCTKNG